MEKTGHRRREGSSCQPVIGKQDSFTSCFIMKKGPDTLEKTLQEELSREELSGRCCKPPPGEAKSKSTGSLNQEREKRCRQDPGYLETKGAKAGFLFRFCINEKELRGWKDGSVVKGIDCSQRTLDQIPAPT
ncbi:hypothetical protein STEG23_008641 [Scotinomys teguina]